MANVKLAIHPAEFWAASETIEKINKRKLCLAAARGDCDGQIVEAHTIPRSQLQRIAIDGHVYHIRATPGDLLANDGRFTVGTRGIGQFSVLNFFCAKHDRDLFFHIENDELVFDSHQLALLHYRAMGAELYKKMNGLEGARYNVKQLQQRTREGDAKRLEHMKAYEAGSKLGLRDMTRTFALCEATLREEEYDRVSGLVVRFKKMPSIMTVGGFSPEFSYNGNRLQKLGRDETTYEQIGFSILAAQEQASLVFTWLKSADVCSSFAQSFVAQDHKLLTTLAIQTAFEHLENTCVNIEWWDSLLKIEREKLLERMQFAGSSFEDRTAACLQYCGITFDEWEYQSHQFLNGVG